MMTVTAGAAGPAVSADQTAADPALHRTAAVCFGVLGTAAAASGFAAAAQGRALSRTKRAGDKTEETCSASHLKNGTEVRGSLQTKRAGDRTEEVCSTSHSQDGGNVATAVSSAQRTRSASAADCVSAGANVFLAAAPASAWCHTVRKRAPRGRAAPAARVSAKAAGPCEVGGAQVADGSQSSSPVAGEHVTSSRAAASLTLQSEGHEDGFAAADARKQLSACEVATIGRSANLSAAVILVHFVSPPLCAAGQHASGVAAKNNRLQTVSCSKHEGPADNFLSPLAASCAHSKSFPCIASQLRDPDDNAPDAAEASSLTRAASETSTRAAAAAASAAAASSAAAEASWQSSRCEALLLSCGPFNILFNCPLHFASLLPQPPAFFSLSALASVRLNTHVPTATIGAPSSLTSGRESNGACRPPSTAAAAESSASAAAAAGGHIPFDAVQAARPACCNVIDAAGAAALLPLKLHAIVATHAEGLLGVPALAQAIDLRDTPVVATPPVLRAAAAALAFLCGTSSGIDLCASSPLLHVPPLLRERHLGSSNYQSRDSPQRSSSTVMSHQKLDGGQSMRKGGTALSRGANSWVAEAAPEERRAGRVLSGASWGNQVWPTTYGQPRLLVDETERQQLLLQPASSGYCVGGANWLLQLPGGGGLQSIFVVGPSSYDASGDNPTRMPLPQQQQQNQASESHTHQQQQQRPQHRSQPEQLDRQKQIPKQRQHDRQQQQQYRSQQQHHPRQQQQRYQQRTTAAVRGGHGSLTTPVRSRYPTAADWSHLKKASLVVFFDCAPLCVSSPAAAAIPPVRLFPLQHLLCHSTSARAFASASVRQRRAASTGLHALSPAGLAGFMQASSSGGAAGSRSQKGGADTTEAGIASLYGWRCLYPLSAAVAALVGVVQESIRRHRKSVLIPVDCCGLLLLELLEPLAAAICTTAAPVSSGPWSGAAHPLYCVGPGVPALLRHAAEGAEWMETSRMQRTLAGQQRLPRPPLLLPATFDEDVLLREGDSDSSSRLLVTAEQVEEVFPLREPCVLLLVGASLRTAEAPLLLQQWAREHAGKRQQRVLLLADRRFFFPAHGAAADLVTAAGATMSANLHCAAAASRGTVVGAVPATSTPQLQRHQDVNGLLGKKDVEHRQQSEGEQVPSETAQAGSEKHEQQLLEALLWPFVVDDNSNAWSSSDCGGTKEGNRWSGGLLVGGVPLDWRLNSRGVISLLLQYQPVAAALPSAVYEQVREEAATERQATLLPQHADTSSSTQQQPLQQGVSATSSKSPQGFSRRFGHVELTTALECMQPNSMKTIIMERWASAADVAVLQQQFALLHIDVSSTSTAAAEAAAAPTAAFSCSTFTLPVPNTRAVAPAFPSLCCLTTAFFKSSRNRSSSRSRSSSMGDVRHRGSAAGLYAAAVRWRQMQEDQSLSVLQQDDQQGRASIAGTRCEGRTSWGPSDLNTRAMPPCAVSAAPLIGGTLLYSGGANSSTSSIEGGLLRLVLSPGDTQQRPGDGARGDVMQQKYGSITALEETGRMAAAAMDGQRRLNAVAAASSDSNDYVNAAVIVTGNLGKQTRAVAGGPTLLFGTFWPEQLLLALLDRGRATQGAYLAPLPCRYHVRSSRSSTPGHRERNVAASRSSTHTRDRGRTVFATGRRASSRHAAAPDGAASAAASGAAPAVGVSAATCAVACDTPAVTCAVPAAEAAAPEEHLCVQPGVQQDEACATSEAETRSAGAVSVKQQTTPRQEMPSDVRLEAEAGPRRLTQQCARCCLSGQSYMRDQGAAIVLPALRARVLCWQPHLTEIEAPARNVRRFLRDVVAQLLLEIRCHSIPTSAAPNGGLQARP